MDILADTVLNVYHLPESDECIKVDYAHEATGFPTWHRQYLLWLEWEIQYMLKSTGQTDYHTFRLNYWDWRNLNRAELFTTERLGANVIDQPGLRGLIFNAGWDTICWYNGSGNVTATKGTICDPRDPTGPIQRCPTVLGINPCTSPNNWPSSEDVEAALIKPLYDTETFNRDATDRSFRNLMEGFENGISDEDCSNNNLCVGGVQRHLHNSVSATLHGQFIVAMEVMAVYVYMHTYIHTRYTHTQ